jgi:CheY-like chemotaxis protein/putative methionine-R-sulfoxide reductase with GAF domain
MPDGARFEKILVLAGSTSWADPVVEALRRQNCSPTVVDSLDEAMLAIGSGAFDAIISQSGDFMAVERSLADMQTRLILDTIGEGVCLVNPQGRIVWSNARMKHWKSDAVDRIRHVCLDAVGAFSASATHPSAAEPLRAKKYSITIDDSQYFEVACSAVLDVTRRLRYVVAICWDETHSRRLQQKLDAIDQAGRELVRLEGESISRLNVVERIKLLEDKIIKFCRQLMHFDHFNIRLVDKKTNKLEPVISVGLPDKAAMVELFAVPEGNGISGYVASTGRSYISPDVTRDPRYVPGLDMAHSSLTVPLMLHDRTIGVFNIESHDYGAFTEDDRQFAEIFGRYVAVALNILDLLVVERYTTSGRLAEDLACEVAGPLNDIAADIDKIADEMILQGDLQARLSNITANLNLIRASLKAVSQGQQILLGSGERPRPGDQDRFLAGKRILVADDAPGICDTLRAVLRRVGAHVDIAENGSQACALLAGEARYDLVISDIKMPDRDGYEIFYTAQRLGHRPPVIFMTAFGYDRNHSIIRARQDGLAAIMLKPFTIKTLMRVVAQALQIPRDAD